MTEYKEKNKERGHRSLYLGLFFNVLWGLLFATLIYCVIRFPAMHIINNYYAAEEMRKERRENYLINLQNFVVNNYIDTENADKIAQWVRDNPYVYLLVYQAPVEIQPRSGTPKSVAPGAKDKLSELSGSRIDESIGRDELINEAKSYGYYEIFLVDGSVIVAITEYTENFYLSLFNAISFAAALLTFLLLLVRYIRVIIERIKRFGSDVTVVSELDMDYEIISEGRDEIATLSKNVEKMRCTMLDHLKNEQEARRANTELITSISHDIRTPLTVLMGYIEMMKEHSASDPTMQSYIEATENTAMRLKQLSDDMLKYSLAFGETEKSVRLENYDLRMLLEQIFSEHILLLREKGYTLQINASGQNIKEGSQLRTDAQNLMRIVDNVFSNLAKYADIEKPITINVNLDADTLVLTFDNYVRKDTEGTESNKIGLKTCVRLASLVAEGFTYERLADRFVCRLYLRIMDGSSIV